MEYALNTVTSTASQFSIFWLQQQLYGLSLLKIVNIVTLLLVVGPTLRVEHPADVVTLTPLLRLILKDSAVKCARRGAGARKRVIARHRDWCCDWPLRATYLHTPWKVSWRSTHYGSSSYRNGKNIHCIDRAPSMKTYAQTRCSFLLWAPFCGAVPLCEDGIDAEYTGKKMPATGGAGKRWFVVCIGTLCDTRASVSQRKYSLLKFRIRLFGDSVTYIPTDNLNCPHPEDVAQRFRQ